MISSRRGFITGLVSLIAAPAIVRFDSIMPVRRLIVPATVDDLRLLNRGLPITPNGGDVVVDWDYGSLHSRMPAGTVTFQAVTSGKDGVLWAGGKTIDRDTLFSPPLGHTGTTPELIRERLQRVANRLVTSKDGQRHTVIGDDGKVIGRDFDDYGLA